MARKLSVIEGLTLETNPPVNKRKEPKMAKTPDIKALKAARREAAAAVRDTTRNLKEKFKDVLADPTDKDVVAHFRSGLSEHTKAFKALVKANDKLFNAEEAMASDE